MKELYKNLNDTTFPYDTSKTIIDYFDQQVLKKPNNIALYYKKEQMTFESFQKRVNQLANCLHGLKLKNSVIRY